MDVKTSTRFSVKKDVRGVARRAILLVTYDIFCL